MAQSLQLARWLQIRMNCVIIISRIADQKANMRKGAALMEQHNYLKTARLELKPLDEKDRESMIRLAEDRQIKKTYMFPDFADRAQEDAFYDRLLALCESGKRFIFGIPLQLFLREILLIHINNAASAASADAGDSLYLDTLLKYALIIISTVPILCIYPFVQKYFMKGVMMGSVKE